MIALARVLFEVRAREVDRLGVGLALLGLNLEGHPAALNHRQLKLTDLVALGQIWIEIILAVEHRTLGHFRTDRQTEADGPLDGADV